VGPAPSDQSFACQAVGLEKPRQHAATDRTRGFGEATGVISSLFVVEWSWAVVWAVAFVRGLAPIGLRQRARRAGKSNLPSRDLAVAERAGALSSGAREHSSGWWC
jgi:hypothetical protein